MHQNKHFRPPNVMDNILHGLNAAQRTAVESSASVVQVLAPPGSGKTKTLTARVAHLVAHRDLRPWNIIVCTFTVKAANEMKERIKNFVGEHTSKQLKLGTFHSVALRYLKAYGEHIGLSKDFGIADTSDSKAILKRIIKKLGLSIEPSQALGRISSRKAKGEVDSKPGKGSKSVEQQEFMRLFDEYEATLKASNLLDYDDLLLRCRFLLQSQPECVSNVQAVLIDEFQDTNNIQYELMGLFAQKQNQITIVGDPDQSIYGFRSAEIKNLGRMKKQWPDTITINLEENYRSSGAILHAAQNIIEQDESRPPKKLQATHTYGLRPVFRRVPSAYAEADWLVSEIKRMRALSGNAMELSDFAVLLRSAALSRTIETALGGAGIAYRMVGGQRFYDREEVRLVVDYLRVIHQPDNSEAIERIINVPSRMIGEKTVKRLRDDSQASNVSMWSLILAISQGRRSLDKLSEPARKGLASFVNVILTGQKKVEAWSTEEPSVTGLISLVAQKIGLQAHLKLKHKDDETFEARWSNVEELMAQAADITAPEQLQELVESEALPQIEGLEQTSTSTEDVLSVFLANIALTASAEKKAEESNEKVQQVTISTIHAAKGLEWPVVFIPACYDGSIPHSRADDHDEERRLLYVGMTRAQALLYLSCPMKSTQREETTISAFLTHPGAIDTFFDQHGPSLPTTAVAGLCETLRKECPTEACIAEAKRELVSDEDNHWPLNGEDVLGESSRWDFGTSGTNLPGFGSARTAVVSAETTMHRPQAFSTASATMQPGFTSVKQRYDDLMEDAQLRKVDKRADERKSAEQAPKGRKRQIEGQGNIASFFAKKQRSIPQPSTAPVLSSNSSQPLRDMSASATNVHRPPVQPQKPSLPSHKPRFAPLLKKPQKMADEIARDDDRYVFLSSSPQKGDDEQDASTKPDENAAEPEDDISTALPTFRPASTFHTTSMTGATTTRKTLGVRRSLQGWSARNMKS